MRLFNSASFKMLILPVILVLVFSYVGVVPAATATLVAVERFNISAGAP